MTVITPNQLLKQYQVPGLFGSSLDCMDQAKCSGHTCKATKLTSHNKGVDIVLRYGQDLRGHQLVLGQTIIITGWRGNL